MRIQKKSAIARTRSPTRETRALPKHDPPMSILLIGNSAHILSAFGSAATCDDLFNFCSMAWRPGFVQKPMVIMRLPQSELLLIFSLTSQAVAPFAGSTVTAE